MRRSLSFLILLIIVIYNVPCAAMEQLSSQEQTLWKKTVSVYLKDDLWLEDEAYDACHTLMVPMHIAFMINDVARINEFDEHVKRFINTYTYGDTEDKANIVSGRLNKLHYFYLLSEYI